MSNPPGITLDLSKSVPLAAAPSPQSGQGVTLDMSKSVPLNPVQQVQNNLGGTDSAGMFGETLKGIGKGVLRTGVEAGEMVNSMLPEDARKMAGIPAETLAKGEAASTPSNTMQSMGSGIEDVGEWVAGDEALKGIFKLTKLAAHAPGAVQIAEKYPKTARLLMGTAKGAAIGGAKGALKGESTGKVEESAIGGAEGGAAGGAISEGVSMALGGAGKAAGVGTEPTEDAVRAARAQKWNTQFTEDWKKAAPYLTKEMESEGTYESVQDAANRIRKIGNDIWANEAKPLVATKAGVVKPTNTIADTLDNEANSIPTIGPANKAQAEKLRDLAKEFRDAKQLTIGQMEALIERNNNMMRATGMFDRSSSARHAMIESDGHLKGAALANEEMRSIMAQEIPELAKLKEGYGAISNVATQIEGQVNVAARQAPISFKRLVGLTAAASGHPLAAVPALLDHFYNNPTALLNRAVQKEAAAAGTSGMAQKAKEVAKTAAVKTAQAIPKAAGEKVGETLAERESKSPQ